MSYYRYPVAGGEFVLRREGGWHITFNGVQIGGRFERAPDALAAISRTRRAELPGPNLAGVEDPPGELALWQHSTSARIS